MNTRILYILILLLIVAKVSGDESFGLRFYAHEKRLDQRTGLNLNPNKPYKIKGNFNLTFELAFMQDKQDYFGYILRVIADDSLNFDLIYDMAKKRISLIAGESSKLVSIPLKIKDLASYKKIVLGFNKDQGIITLIVDGEQYSLNSESLKTNHRWKFLFGINHNRKFKTTDLPSMQIRNVSLTVNGQKKHEWLLNNQTGNWVKDEVGNYDAYVENPAWLFDDHDTWVLEKEFLFDSYTPFVQKGNSDTVFFLSNNKLYTYFLPEQRVIKTESLKKDILLTQGMQLEYNSVEDQILQYCIDNKSVTSIDIKTLQPSALINESKRLTAFWHHNKFFNPKDTTLITIGGYGYLTYKNLIHTVNLNNGNWNVTSPEKTEFMPRYLSALGANKTKDTLYILGGYGSLTGDQKINPGYIYDLVQYIPESKKVSKIFTVDNSKIESFCLSNSMIIDYDNSEYYALAYSKYEFKNNFRLIKGSLNDPNIVIDDKSIPFNFHDIRSYIDLVYSPLQRKLYAFILFYNDDKKTSIKIYSISFKPALQPPSEEIIKTKNNVYLLIGAITLFILIFGGLIFIFYRRKQNSKNQKDLSIHQGNAINLNKGASIHKESDEQKQVNNQQEPQAPEEEIIIPKKSYSISFFGGFQVITKDGENITKKFTPLLKELFLLIYLKSFGNTDRGISSSKLKEILWYDKTDKDARNNRAVNIARLKGLLKKVGNIEISKSTGYWVMSIEDDSLEVDYNNYLNISEKKYPAKEDILEFIHFTKKGEFLQNLSYDWLDKYKAEVAENIIDTLINYANQNKNDLDAAFLIQMADIVLLFDSVNEEALEIKCKSLVKSGKHTLAKKNYENFKKEYKLLYGENFKVSFNSLFEQV